MRRHPLTRRSGGAGRQAAWFVGVGSDAVGLALGRPQGTAARNNTGRGERGARPRAIRTDMQRDRKVPRARGLAATRSQQTSVATRQGAAMPACAPTRRRTHPARRGRNPCVAFGARVTSRRARLRNPCSAFRPRVTSQRARLRNPCWVFTTRVTELRNPCEVFSPKVTYSPSMQHCICLDRVYRTTYKTAHEAWASFVTRGTSRPHRCMARRVHRAMHGSALRRRPSVRGAASDGGRPVRRRG